MRGSLTRSTGAKAKITERDLLLFSLLLDFRLMDTKQIMTWLGRDTPVKIRDTQDRLKLLFNKPNAYIDRVSRGQYFIEGGGTEPMVYALNNKGRKILIESNKEKYIGIRKRVSNTTLKSNFIGHTLFNTDVATHIKRACNQSEEWLYAHRSVFFDELITPDLHHHPQRHLNNYYGWPVAYHVEKTDRYGEKVIAQESKTLVPDYLSIIVNKNTRNEIFLFAEVDNSTEPVERLSSKLKHSDVWEKFALYDRSAKDQLFKKYFNLESPFRILFITCSELRMENMIAANKHPEIRQGRGWHKFLFTTRDSLNQHGFLDAPWRNGEDKNLFYFRNLEI